MNIKAPRSTVIAVVGPTASGKTSLSIKLGKELGGEVIACDSRTVYKYMDIGTAKPTKEEQAGIPHHMLDIVEPDSTYTAGQYKKDATPILDSIMERGKIPIVCGGTGFYARALLEGLSIPDVPPDNELREELQKTAELNGNQALHARLAEVDPVSAGRIQENDRFRIIRALEVSTVLEVPFSEATKREEVPFDVVWIGLTYADRTRLRSNIETRLSEQVETGLEEESRTLFEKYGATRALTNAVTYKQFIQYFKGEITYEETISECVRHNYQLARKQLIWFRANEATRWIEIDNCESPYQEAFDYLKEIGRNHS